MDEFYGVFDGENVLRLGLVQIVDHGGERGALTRARGPGHDNKAAGCIGDSLKDWPEPKPLHRHNIGRDCAEYCTGAAVLVKGIDTKPCDARQLIGKVDFQIRFEFAALILLHHFVQQS